MESFWATISKYPAFIIGAVLGVFFNAANPLIALLKNPITAIALIGVIGAGLACIGFTLRAMLGLGMS
ncbi:MAG: DUF751 family protein [Leptolyngbyaceae cyanobacterium]